MRGAVVATPGASSPQTPRLRRIRPTSTPQSAHGVHAWAQDESVCTSSQVQAHVHEHKYPHTHTASEQMTQRFLWKDVRSI